MTVEVAARPVPAVSWVRGVRLPLRPHSPGTVNAYLVSTGDGPVLVDTGFHSTATILGDAMTASGIARGELAATLVTHNHADHVGGSRWLRTNDWYRPGGALVMHELTDQVGREVFVDVDGRQRRQLLDNGLTADQAARWEADVAAMAGLADWPAADRLVRGGEAVEVGGVLFTFVHTPGHSPDHCAIRAELDGERVVFLGDLTLGRGMPRVGVRDWHRDDPIQDLLDSWWLVRGFDVRVGLPGHGGPVEDLLALDADIRAACDEELRSFVRRYGGRVVSAADVMDTEVAGLPDASFGLRQFTFYGALATLTHLHRKGLARLVPGSPIRYEVTSAG